jgi:hypothetical protein
MSGKTFVLMANAGSQHEFFASHIFAARATRMRKVATAHDVAVTHPPRRMQQPARRRITIRPTDLRVSHLAGFCPPPVAFARSLRKDIDGLGRGPRTTRDEPMRRLWAPSKIRSGPGISAPPKGSRKKKSRKSSRATSRRTPIFRSKNGRRRSKQSSKAKLISNADLGRGRRYPWLKMRGRRGPADGNVAPGHSRKLRGLGPFYVRALRAHWRLAPASRPHFRYAAKQSSAAPMHVIRRGWELIDWALLKAQQLKETLGGAISQNNVSKPPAVIETATEIIPSASEPIQQGALPVIDQVEAAPPPTPPPTPKKNWRDRVPIAAEELELAIADAVKKAAPGCEAFVGVIVQQTTPRSRFDTNWAVRGVKYGKAGRETVTGALATIVERMQQEFRLSEE